MKILINDFEETQEVYIKIFQEYGYEKNELIFRKSFQDTRDFFVQQLEKNKQHIDLIITNDAREHPLGDILESSKLCLLKNSLTASFSNRNFRICSIPLILYSQNDTKSNFMMGFDAIVKKNEEGYHDYFIHQCESVIRNWRENLLNDLDTLHVRPNDLTNFAYSKSFREYRFTVLLKPDYYFTHLTKVVSSEFIKCPAPLNYDWMQLSEEDIEKPYALFNRTLKHHLKYDRKNNERTIWHNLFIENPRLITRDVYNGFLHEKNLNEEKNQESQECDFILTTEYPEYLNTTFLEVKREDKKYYVKKHCKRPQIGRDFFSDLTQVWDYKKYTSNPQYQEERENKIGYNTSRFEHVLLAGRQEEKEEMQEVFANDLKDHFSGITVHSFEEFAEVYSNYINKFSRLHI